MNRRAFLKCLSGTSAAMTLTPSERPALPIRPRRIHSPGCFYSYALKSPTIAYKAVRLLDVSTPYRYPPERSPAILRRQTVTL